ncbi:hypothetical protein [Azohydromonas lata]|uniref:Uncharacterized protein n=1 Tax=Azohydromonas lata TaxID=45677 RepID=A0ABU5INE4_9BURK|nr:hypothetical protein [Azohydromonas lata]MDZ5460404.1 hypothetical protein [Azohydromonas lata]
MKTVVLAFTLLVVAAVAQAEGTTQAASTQATAVRANGEHPAVLVARQYREGAIDANRFIVAPPASTRWTSGPALDNTAPVQSASAR